MFDSLLWCLEEQKWVWSHPKVCKRNSPNVNKSWQTGLDVGGRQILFNDGDCLQSQDGSCVVTSQCISSRSRVGWVRPWATSSTLTECFSACVITFTARRGRQNSLTGLKWTDTPAPMLTSLPKSVMSCYINKIKWLHKKYKNKNDFRNRYRWMYYCRFSNLDQNVCSLFQREQRWLSSGGKTALPSIQAASWPYHPSPRTGQRNDHQRSHSTLALGPAPWQQESWRTRRVYGIHPAASDSWRNSSGIKNRSVGDTGRYRSSYSGHTLPS